MDARRCLTAEDALAFVRLQGIVLVSAAGAAPKLTEAIVGEPIAGSWWAHPQGRRIYAIVGAVTESDEVLVCRLLEDKVTLVHRRLWPALVRMAERFAAARLARVREEHTRSGRHVTRETAFPDWVPADVMAEARAISTEDATLALGAWVTAPAVAKRSRASIRPGARSP